jgi:hypothetical protein
MLNFRLIKYNEVPMSDYVFEGEIIKLAAKDFYKWQDMYKHLNLVEELQQLDMELDGKRMEGGNVKKWFSECIARLNGRNKRAERFNRGSNQQSNGSYSSSCKAGHADRTRAQANAALQRIDRENDYPPIYPPSGFIRQ